MKNLISFMLFFVSCNFLTAMLINSPIENALTQELNADTTQQVTARQVDDMQSDASAVQASASSASGRDLYSEHRRERNFYIESCNDIYRCFLSIVLIITKLI